MWMAMGFEYCVCAVALSETVKESKWQSRGYRVVELTDKSVRYKFASR
jgi:hypothetical protein